MAFAPASLATKLLAQNQGSDLPIQLVQPGGTLWSGYGTLLNQGQALGNLRWQAKPSSLLSGRVGADLWLDLLGQSSGSSGGKLSGNLTSNTSSTSLDLQGKLAGSWISQWLAQYEVELGGEINTDNFRASLDPNNYLRTLAAQGDLTWSGGLVRYRLGNRLANQRLAPMNAVVQGDMANPEGITAEVFGQESYPLLKLALLPDGHAKVSITQRLTEIVGAPWPGSEPDHELVLVVEQAVF